MHAVRIWYKKYGTAKFISHLDLYRCLCRAVRRAGIPLWYTEGFNPRPYLNILMALLWVRRLTVSLWILGLRAK
jgi:radical SAM-linked protein